MSRSEISAKSTLPSPPVVPPTQPESLPVPPTGEAGTTAGSAPVNTTAVDAVNNATCEECASINLVPVNLPGLGETYLEASFAQKVQAFIDNAASKGVALKFNSGFRTPEYQKNKIMNDPTAITPAQKSLHSCGFAVDINYRSAGGPEVQKKIREAAQDAGLKWGGNFRRPDPPHFYDNPPIDRKKAIECAVKRYQQLNP